MTDKISAVHPLRVAAYFEERDLVIERPSAMSIRVLLDNAAIVCELANPDIFQVSSIWKGVVQKPRDLARLLELISSSNATLFAPKAYTIPGPRLGITYLGAEGNIPISSGLSELQFYSFIETTVTAIIGLFTQVELLLPHLVTWNSTSAATTNTKLGRLFTLKVAAEDRGPLSDGANR